MSRKTELNKIIKKAREELYKIESEDKIKINKKFVGKCFKYENGYNNDDRWSMYIIITKLSKNGSLEGWSFQTNSDESTEISREAYGSIWSEHIEITHDEFWEAWYKLLSNLKLLGDNNFLS